MFPAGYQDRHGPSSRSLRCRALASDRIEIAGETWRVTDERTAEDVRATALFLCDLAQGQRELDARVRAWNAEITERIKKPGEPMEHNRRDSDD